MKYLVIARCSNEQELIDYISEIWGIDIQPAEKVIDEKVWEEIDRRENELGRKLTIKETEEVWKEMENNNGV